MYGRFLRNEKGSALLMAIMGLAIISIITITAVFMGSTNARQTQTEGKRTQAYYVADAGAKTLVENLKGKDPKELKKELDIMVGKGKVEGKYQEDGTSTNEWKFEIEVLKDDPAVDVYEIRSTGYANDIKDGTRAFITLGETSTGGGSGLIMGDGVIYVTTPKSGEFQFHNFGQFGNTDLSIYTVNKNVTAINDGTSGYKKTSSTDNGMVKDLFEKTAGAKVEHTVEMVYNLNRDMVRAKYLDEKLINGELKDEELKKAIESSYFLPITLENHEAFLADAAIFPEAKYNLPTGEKESKISLPSKGNIDMTDSNYVRVSNKLEVTGGDLNITTSGVTNIIFDDEVLIVKGATLRIHSDSRVNVFFTKRSGTSGGNIEVISPEGTMAQVNFYVLGSAPFQAQSGTKVTGCVNLYAPTSDVQLQEKIRWEGIVVANQLEFNDNVLFRAPSAGDDFSDMNKDKNKIWTLDDIEWKEWQQ